MAYSALTPDFNIDEMSDEAALAMCALIGADIDHHYLDLTSWRFSLPGWGSFSLSYKSQGGAARSALRAYYYNISEFDEYRTKALNAERHNLWRAP